MTFWSCPPFPDKPIPGPSKYLQIVLEVEVSTREVYRGSRSSQSQLQTFSSCVVLSLEPVLALLGFRVVMPEFWTIGPSKKRCPGWSDDKTKSYTACEPVLRIAIPVNIGGKLEWPKGLHDFHHFWMAQTYRLEKTPKIFCSCFSIPWRSFRPSHGSKVRKKSKIDRTCFTKMTINWG